MCHVVHETLVGHRRACAAVGVESDGVGISGEGALSDEAGLDAADGDGLACATISTRTNGVVATRAFCGGDTGHRIVNEDVPAIGIVIATADTRSFLTAGGVNGATPDADDAARAIPAAADTRSIFTASGVDGATADGNIATRGCRAAADTRSTKIASGVECSVALERKGLVVGYMDAGTLISPLHIVGRVST